MLKRNGRLDAGKLSVAAVASLMIAVLALTIGTGKAMAQGNCRRVHGHITSQLVPPPPAGTCASLVGFCTSGTLIGGIQGTFAFTATSLLPSPDLPSILLFTGRTDIQTKDGSTLAAVNAGALDTNPASDGHFADLITFTGGTGDAAGASGHIVAFGNFDLLAGLGVSDYTGELCTP